MCVWEGGGAEWHSVPFFFLGSEVPPEVTFATRSEFIADPVMLFSIRFNDKPKGEINFKFAKRQSESANDTLAASIEAPAYEEGAADTA